LKTRDAGFFALGVLLTGLAWFLSREGSPFVQADERNLRSKALAIAGPQQVILRYAPPLSGDLAPEPASSGEAGTARAGQLLRDWGWKLSEAPAAAWSPATGKLAVYQENWVWVTDAKGRNLRSVWYEPDLRADGQLRWSPDGTVLWIRADGWRRWVSLEVEVEPPTTRR